MTWCIKALKIRKTLLQEEREHWERLQCSTAGL